MSLTAAAMVVAALGEIRRFEIAWQLMAHLGLDPSEHSSAESRRKTGTIPRTGQHDARWAVVEVVWSDRFTPEMGAEIRRRGNTFSERYAKSPGRLDSTSTAASGTAIVTPAQRSRQPTRSPPAHASSLRCPRGAPASSPGTREPPAAAGPLAVRYAGRQKFETRWGHRRWAEQRDAEPDRTRFSLTVGAAPWIVAGDLAGAKVVEVMPRGAEPAEEGGR